MCVYSMIGDHYLDKWQQPRTTPVISPIPWTVSPVVPMPFPATLPTPEEIQDFRKDAEELKRLLKRAKAYDAKNHEPDCGLDEKKQKLRDIAAHYGVEIEFP